MSSYLEDPEHRDLNLPELRRLRLSSARAMLQPVIGGVNIVNLSPWP
jgi:hypothetical protein